MCSFFAVNEHCCGAYAEHLNALSRRRGPDNTTALSVHGHTFVHNLLSLTGERVAQPFVDAANELVCLFNGEIYNYREKGDYPSDGACILPLYRKHGPAFTRHIDGEYAIVVYDFRQRTIVSATDAFATKPLWIGRTRGRVALASYRSTLDRLQLPAEKLPANTTIVYSLDTGKEGERMTTIAFDPDHQSKDTYDDWVSAFERAIAKRTMDHRDRLFIGLSSGYDSGAIAWELIRQRVPFAAYSVRGNENLQVLEQRHQIIASAQMLDISQAQYAFLEEDIRRICEPIVGTKVHGDMTASKGAIGIYIICDAAVRTGRNILLSGQGADEIMSDYGIAGRPVGAGRQVTDFAGRFPEELARYFPWKNFYTGNQEAFIAVNEHAAGAFGVETRYPFLDPALVQEFLWLKPELKNRAYKAPLAHYLSRHAVPYSPEEKMGFSPNENLR